MASNRSLLIIAKCILASYALFVIYICSTILYHRIHGSKPTHFTYLTVDFLNVFESAPAKHQLPVILLLYWFALVSIYSMIVILYNINYEKTALPSITKHVLRGPFAETPLFPLMNVAIDWALLFGAKNVRGLNMLVPVYLGLALVTIANIWIIYDHYYKDQRQENAQNDVEGMGQQELSSQTSKPYLIVSKMFQRMLIIKFLLLLIYCVFFLCVSIAIIESDFGRQYRKNFTLQSKEDVLTYRLYVASFVSLNLALIGLFNFTIFAPLCLSVHVFLIYTDILYVNRSVISPNVRIVVCGLQFIFAIMEIVSLSFAYDLYTIRKRKVAYEKANRENAQIVPNKVTKCVACQTDYDCDYDDDDYDDDDYDDRAIAL